MSLRPARNAAVAVVLVLIQGSSARPPAPLGETSRYLAWPVPTSLADARLEPERKASVSWEVRTGPQRRVVDLACLVPDVASFLNAITAWDDRQFFPILIDTDVNTCKFLRAFRPARVVRYASPPQAGQPDRAWEIARDSVRDAWVGSSMADRGHLRGDEVPRGLGPTPPGVVVTDPASPTVAGAVALAAGRFQPLLRWEPGRGYADRLSAGDADRLVHDLEARIGDRIAHDGVLGDTCDFITLAGDYPYRYDTPAGENAFDDLVARSPLSLRRWAYTGRLVGSPAASVYMAMCSLFLEPHSALLFNSYQQSTGVWSDYRIEPAAEALRPFLRVASRSGQRQASLAGWHAAFDPFNRFELVMINSSGYPGLFSLRDGVGYSGDVPWSVPTAVWQLHSHSAADPIDPDTLAGRWLANGAFLYVGAMNEPYLHSFRTPQLVASLSASGLPLGALVRPSTGESFGYPWRVVYIGDPLYRLIGPREELPRVRWDVVPDWPDVNRAARPSANAADDAKLAWALDCAIVKALGEASAEEAEELGAVVLEIRRERLAPARIGRLDNLLANLLDEPALHDAIRQRVATIAPGSLTPALKRRLEADRVADLHRALARSDLPAASAAWNELIQSDSPAELKAAVTSRVGALADKPERLRAWRNRLRETLQTVRGSPSAANVETELRRIEQRLGL